MINDKNTASVTVPLNVEGISKKVNIDIVSYRPGQWYLKGVGQVSKAIKALVNGLGYNCTVYSKSYSGGDSVTVRVDGVTSVKDANTIVNIANTFEEGNFDGSDNHYEYDGKPPSFEYDGCPVELRTKYAFVEINGFNYNGGEVIPNIDGSGYPRKDGYDYLY